MLHCRADEHTHYEYIDADDWQGFFDETHCLHQDHKVSVSDMASAMALEAELSKRGSSLAELLAEQFDATATGREATAAEWEELGSVGQFPEKRVDFAPWAPGGT